MSSILDNKQTKLQAAYRRHRDALQTFPLMDCKDHRLALLENYNTWNITKLTRVYENFTLLRKT